MFVDELKTYLHSEITQQSAERAADVTTLKQESIRCKLVSYKITQKSIPVNLWHRTRRETSKLPCTRTQSTFIEI
jgi:hypothetical protein